MELESVYDLARGWSEVPLLQKSKSTIKDLLYSNMLLSTQPKSVGSKYYFRNNPTVEIFTVFWKRKTPPVCGCSSYCLPLKLICWHAPPPTMAAIGNCWVSSILTKLNTLGLWWCAHRTSISEFYWGFLFSNFFVLPDCRDRLPKAGNLTKVLQTCSQLILG